ncbi:MAG: hypothetical protein ACK4NP_09020 [Parvularculaceae bacterium]
MPGGLVETRATLRASRFEDPLTGAARPLTDIASPVVTIKFRQHLAGLRTSWAASYKLPEKTDLIFANETFAFHDGKEISAFVEMTRYLGVKSRLSLRGIGGRRFGATRTFFSPDRSGVITGFEPPDRRRGLFVTLSVEGQRWSRRDARAARHGQPPHWRLPGVARIARTARTSLHCKGSVL